VVKWLACLALMTGCELFVNVPNATLANGDDGTDGGKSCSESSPCVSPTPFCNTQSGTCVECLTSPDCTMPALAICDANVCRGCVADMECPSSNVCLGDGTCADPARVVYASPTGTGATCTTATPCTLDTAIAQVEQPAATQDIIKLAAGTYDRPAMSTIDTHGVIITGEGAILHGSGGAAIVMLYATGVPLTVMHVDFELAGDYGAECTGAGGALTLDRVKMSGGGAGVYVNACPFTLDRSTIDGNTLYAAYLIGSTVSITNSFITNNSAMSLGGFVFAAGTTGTVEHVTVSGNGASSGAHAMRCTDVGHPTIRSSIIYGNGTPSIDPNCTVGFSVVDPDYTGGANNVSMDPLYVAPGTHDYHIQSGSPAAAHSDPASAQVHDVDGDPRPQPTGSLADSGADEIP